MHWKPDVGPFRRLFIPWTTGVRIASGWKLEDLRSTELVEVENSPETALSAPRPETKLNEAYFTFSLFRGRDKWKVLLRRNHRVSL